MKTISLPFAPSCKTPLVMHAYAHAFSDEEVHDWLKRQMTRYAHDGFGLWALIRKSDGAFIGQCGITMQEVGKTRVPELGWLLRRDCWHQGHASEAAPGLPRIRLRSIRI